MGKKLFISIYESGGRISTVTDIGPGVVGDRRVADLTDVADVLEPRRDPENSSLLLLYIKNAFLIRSKNDLLPF